jgi:hypothetical protein
VYKTEDNKKCAVGALLKPSLYEDRFDESDGVGVRGLPDNVHNYLGRENLDWLSSLQATHDECARVWHKDHEDDTYTENPHFGKYFLAVAKEQNLLS